MTIDTDFLDDFTKELDELEGVSTSSAPPRYWYSTGNFVLNKIISGSFYKGIPQGRVTNLSGPSGSGKSFVAANLIRQAQKAGAMILVVDSENALDDTFMQKIGVNTSRDAGYRYAGVTTLDDCVEVVQKYLANYKRHFSEDFENAPQVLIVVDSLDMLLTETELDHYNKGEQKGDQGQKNKQLKKMLKTFVQDVKPLNVAMVVTSQVYKNQDLMNGEGLWIVSDAVQFSASQIVLLTKMKLKETGSSVVMGIRMKCEGKKTRFTKPFQTVVIEVPYETGIDPYSGLVETLIEMQIVEKAGSRYRVKGQDTTWYEKDVGTVADALLLHAETQTEAYLKARIADVLDEDDQTDSETETAERRRKKATKR